MEIPVQVAVRIYNTKEDESSCVRVKPLSPTYSQNQFISPIASGVIQAGAAHSYPVTHTLPIGCSQQQIYHQAVYPLICLFLEGFDASIITYGQKSTGKTYTFFGPSIDYNADEAEIGIVHRSLQDIFAHLSQYRERNSIVNIGWVEIVENQIIDLLGAGNIVCHSAGEVLQWLKAGVINRAAGENHTLFTITLEQRWISSDGLIQHRLSTASFSDLCCTERMFMMNSMEQHVSVPKNLGLQSLERIVALLSDRSFFFGNNNIQYNETTLTTLLKDSFGGRAQTLIIMCVSPLERDLTETINNLEFSFKAQNVRNFVLMNTYSDNNTPISAEILTEFATDPEHFGIQFAASQWLKLVSNAEGLFSRLIANKSITNSDKQQIEEWLFLKQECDECLSSGDQNLRCKNQLRPIHETEEPDENESETEDSYKQNSDNESYIELPRPELEEKIENLMNQFKNKTDTYIIVKYQEFIKALPKVTINSTQSFGTDENRVGGRRRSIYPGSSLNSAEIAMLNQVASRDKLQLKSNESLIDNTTDVHAQILLNTSSSQKELRRIDAEIKEKQRQMEEIKKNLVLRKRLISDLLTHNTTRTTIKQRFNKRRNKLEAEYDKIQKQLTKCILNRCDKTEIERFESLLDHIRQRLDDLSSIKLIADESDLKIKKLQQSVEDSNKQLKILQDSVKRNMKDKEQLETKKGKNLSKKNLTGDKQKILKEVQARICHLEQVLKEKSHNLDKFETDNGVKDPLRYEIRNLRRTRDHLLENQCYLRKKLNEKTLSHREERKLLECDEAIEAIDAAIEYKNELICGHNLIDTTERIDRDKGEEMLMARLNNLPEEEMHTLFYKYFNKVVDLKGSTHKLEVQLLKIERERDALEWEKRDLIYKIKQTRVEAERNLVLLQRQHENKLALMWRHLADETSTSSSFSNTNFHSAVQEHLKYPCVRFSHPIQLAENKKLELENLKAEKSIQLMDTTHVDMNLCPVSGQIDKSKLRHTKNKLFTKFQVLTRYHGSGGARGSGEKKKSQEIVIPEANLKHLSLPMPVLTTTKVTRQKNKIIIQDPSRTS